MLACWRAASACAGAEPLPVEAHDLAICPPRLGLCREQDVVAVFDRALGRPGAGHVLGVDRVPHPLGRHEPHRQERPARHVQVQRVVAAPQRFGREGIEIGHQGQGRAARLHEDHRGLVLAVRNKPADRRGVGPIGPIEEAEAIGKGVERKCGLRLQSRGQVQPVAVAAIGKADRARQAMPSHGELLHQRPIHQADAFGLARQGLPVRGDQRKGADAPAGRDGRGDPAVLEANGIPLLQLAVGKRRLDPHAGPLEHRGPSGPSRMTVCQQGEKGQCRIEARRKIGSLGSTHHLAPRGPLPYL